MGRGTRSTTAAAAPATSAPRASARAADPVLTACIACLRGESYDRNLREKLARSGLMSVKHSRYGNKSMVATSLGKIIAEKGRLPTPTEIERTIKRLDRELAAAGVRGDVTSGSYSYPQSRESYETSRLQLLISDRQSISTYKSAQEAGRFEAVRIRNAAARAAQQRLAEHLERSSAERSYLSDLGRYAEQLRAGQISVEDAVSAVNTANPMILGSPHRASGEHEFFEAIRIGLGLPTTKDKIVRDNVRQEAHLHDVLDRIDAGQTPLSDDGETEWSKRYVSDSRVARAAFGYCDAAARIQVDYHQAAIIELRDGSIHEFEVKRAHSDLEPHVEDVVRHRRYFDERVAEAEQLQQRAAKLLRRWARQQGAAAA